MKACQAARPTATNGSFPSLSKAAKAEEDKIDGEEKNEGVTVGGKDRNDDEDNSGDKVKAAENDEDSENKIEEDGGAKTNGENDEGKEDDFKSVANKEVESDSSSESDGASPIPSPPPSAAAQLRTPVTPATDDPNFAVVCVFLEKFGAKCNLECPSIGRLQGPNSIETFLA